jgi:hypothetical protein
VFGKPVALAGAESFGGVVSLAFSAAPAVCADLASVGGSAGFCQGLADAASSSNPSDTRVAAIRKRAAEEAA